MNTPLKTLSPEDLKEKHTIDLKVATPVHIGSREGRLTALEYVVCDGRTHIIDEDLFGRFLKAKGLIDVFVRDAGSSGPFSMEDFLRNRARMDVKKVVPSLSTISSLSITGGGARMMDFRPFIRDGNGQVYIPGSSLKGVFRTALLYGLLHADAPLRDQMERKTVSETHILRTRPGKKTFFSENWLQRDLLQSFQLAGAKHGPNEDILRCLTVRDAYPVGSVRTEIIRIQFLSKSSEETFYWSSKKKRNIDTGKPLDLWLEAVLGGVFRVELLWDRKLFETFKGQSPNARFPISGLVDLMEKTHEMSRDLFAYEKDFLTAKQAGQNATSSTGDIQSRREAGDTAKSLLNWYSTHPSDCIRIGFGSGMLGTTVNMLFSKEVRQEIRNLCGHPRGDDPAPKSRRIWKSPKDQWMPLGWILTGPAGQAFPKAPFELDSKDSQPVSRPPSSPPVSPLSKVPPAKYTEPVKSGAPALLKRLAMIEAHDKLAMERIINALEDIDKEDDARQLAEALRDKLKKGGIWEKHPLRREIEMYLI